MAMIKRKLYCAWWDPRVLGLRIQENVDENNICELLVHDVVLLG
jgi:hypothetical protein